MRHMAGCPLGHLKPKGEVGKQDPSKANKHCQKQKSAPSQKKCGSRKLTTIILETADILHAFEAAGIVDILVLPIRLSLTIGFNNQKLNIA